MSEKPNEYFKFSNFAMILNPNRGFGQAKVKNPNNKIIDVQSEKRCIIRMDMESMKYMHGIHKNNPYGDDAKHTFFGIVLSQFPKLEIGEYGYVKSNEFFRKVFWEHYVPFLNEWWVSYMTVGIHFYRFIYIEQHNIYVPKSVDINMGQAYCLYDYDNTGAQEFIWQHNVTLTVDPNLNDPNKISYDPNVSFILTKAFQFPDIGNYCDNIMEWVAHIDATLSNMRSFPPYRQLTHPYDTPLSKLLPLIFKVKQLEDSEIKMEQMKANIHVIWKNTIDYHDEPYGNIINSYAEKDTDYTKLAQHINFNKFWRTNQGRTRNDGQHSNATMAVLDSYAQQMRNGSGSAQQQPPRNMSTAPESNGYMYGNSDTYSGGSNGNTSSITNLNEMRLRAPPSQGQVVNALLRATQENVGITTEPIRNGELTSIFPGPVHEPTIVEKHTAKDNSAIYKTLHDGFSTAYGMLVLQGGVGDSRVGETTVKIANENMKYRILNIMKQMESALNLTYKKLLEDDVKVMKDFLEEFDSIPTTDDFLEVRFHFQPTFSQNMTDLMMFYDKGILDAKFIQNIVLQQLGLHETLELVKGEKTTEDFIPDAPFDLREINQTKQLQTIETARISQKKEELSMMSRDISNREKTAPAPKPAPKKEKKKAKKTTKKRKVKDSSDSSSSESSSEDDGGKSEKKTTSKEKKKSKKVSPSSESDGEVVKDKPKKKKKKKSEDNGGEVVEGDGGAK